MELKTKVLIVEDETNTATTFEEAISSVQENKPDIIIMDINLKNSLDGITTACEIKKIDNIPIIYLTAFCDDETIKRAIQTNPVGYLLKPFKIDELKSTILLGMFKSKQNHKQPINKEFKSLGNDYYYDEKNQALYYKENPIKLSSKESALLYILYKNKGKVVPFENIEHHLWEDYTVSNSTLRTLIYRLRSKLEYKLIETIPLTGCKLK